MSGLSGLSGLQPRQARQRADERLAARIREVRAASCGAYGSPRVTAELKNKGLHVNEKRVSRVMRRTVNNAGCSRVGLTSHVPRHWRSLPGSAVIVPHSWAAMEPAIPRTSDPEAHPSEIARS
ncbi:IS3 family transposase [Streptomyces sp. NPDC059166]|uniref:IS3 family transposase n=1 Tax=Streptomyces sp. NPDC059166 TaxID=3346752 RepID=UPI003683B3C0